MRSLNAEQGREKYAQGQHRLLFSYTNVLKALMPVGCGNEAWLELGDESSCWQ